MTEGDRRASRGVWTLAILGVILAAVVPYLGVLDTPFVFDDVKLVRDNRFLRSDVEDSPGVLETFNILDRRWDDEELRPNYRPLRFLSYKLDYKLSEWLLDDFEPDAPPVFFFHLSNVLLHAANAVLVLLLVRLLLGSIRGRDDEDGAVDESSARWAVLGAFWAAILFALHPLQTEAVTYVSGRRDVLSTFFLLAALFLHVRTAPRASPRVPTIVLVPLLFAAGLLSKEMVITLPCVMLLLDLARGARWEVGRVLTHAVVWVVALLFVGVTLSNERLFEAAVGMEAQDIARIPLRSETFLTAARYVARYFLLAVFPYPQSVDYSFDAIPESTGLFSPWTAVPSLLLVMGIAAVGGIRILGWRTSPWKVLTAVGGLWFVGTLVPVLQFVPAAERFAERFAYLPLIGGILVFGTVIARALRSEPPILGHGVAAFVCLLALGFTLNRNRDWESPLTLWTSATEAQPRAARAHVGRANALKGAEKYREAIREYGLALEIFEERPDVPLHHGFILQARTQRGSLLGLLGGRDPTLLSRAVADYRHVLASRDTDGVEIATSPDHTVLHFDLAGLLLRQEKLEEAREEYSRVIELGRPETLVGAAHYYLGKIALHLGEVKEAVMRHRRAYDSISRDDPVRYQVAVELADILVDQKDYDDAWSFIESALEESGRRRERLHLLMRQSKILDRRGDLTGCIEKLEDILSQDSTYGPALVTLAGIRLTREEFDEAEAAYRAVASTDLMYREAQEGLSNVRVRRQLAAERKEGPEPVSPEGERVLQAIVEKGDGHLKREEWIAAREAFVRLLARARETGRPELERKALRELALIEEKFSRYKEAKQYLDAAIGLEPADAEALRRLGDLHLRRLDDRAAALRYYEQYLSVLPAGVPADSGVYFNLAQLKAEEDPAAAIAHCLKAREGRQDAPLIDRTLGYLYAATGDWEKSLESFTSYLEATAGEDDPEREAARKFVEERVLPQVLREP